MERVLLWLDELDDCLVMSVHGLARIRLHCLKTGLSAALALPLVEASGAYVNVFAGVAGISVLIWTGAVAAELVASARAGTARAA